MAYVAIGGGTVADAAAGNLANYMPIVWAKKVLDFVEKNLVLWNCIDTSWSEQFAGQKGDTLRINPLLEITAAAVNTSADPTAYDTDQGAYTDLVINYWYESVVGVTDFQGLLGQPDYEKLIIPRLGYAIAKQIDSTIANLIDATDLDQRVGTEGVALSYETLLDAKAYLDIAGAPEEDRFLVIDPESLTDLMKDEAFISALYNAGSAIGKGWVGQHKPLGCTVFMTSNLQAVNTSYHGAAMFQREAWAGCMKQAIEYATWRKEERHTTFHRASALWGAVEARDTFAVYVRTRS